MHRDLKPANIKITPDGRRQGARLRAGEGVDRRRHAGDLTQSPTITIDGTRDGVILGHRRLHEPRAGARQAGRQAHRHLGVRLRAVRDADGARRVRGETRLRHDRGDSRARARLGALPAPTPPRVRRLLQRCLEKDPKRRLRDIGDARIEIEDVLGGAAGPRGRGGRSAHGDSLTDRVGRSRILVALVLVGGAGVLMARSCCRDKSPQMSPTTMAASGSLRARPSDRSLALARGTRSRLRRNLTTSFVRPLDGLDPTAIYTVDCASRLGLFLAHGQWVAFAGWPARSGGWRLPAGRRRPSHWTDLGWRDLGTDDTIIFVDAATRVRSAARVGRRR